MDVDQVLFALKIIIENLPLTETTSNWLSICKATKNTVPCCTNIYDATANFLPWLKKLGQNCFDLCPFAVKSGDLSLLEYCGNKTKWNFSYSFKRKIGKAICESPSLCLTEFELKPMFSLYISMDRILKYATRNTLQTIWDNRHTIFPHLTSIEIVRRIGSVDHENQLDLRFEYYCWILDAAPELFVFINPTYFIQSFVRYNSISYLKLYLEKIQFESDVKYLIGAWAFKYNNLEIFKWACENEYVGNLLYHGSYIGIELFYFAYKTIQSKRFRKSFELWDCWPLIKNKMFDVFDFFWEKNKRPLRIDCILFLIEAKRYSTVQLLEFTQNMAYTSVEYEVIATAELLTLFEEAKILNNFKYQLMGPNLENWLPKLTQKANIAKFWPRQLDPTNKNLELLDFRIDETDRSAVAAIFSFKEFRHSRIWQLLLEANPRLLLSAVSFRCYDGLIWIADTFAAEFQIFVQKNKDSLFVFATMTKILELGETALLFWRKIVTPSIICAYPKVIYSAFLIMTEEEIRCFAWDKFDCNQVSQFEYWKMTKKLKREFNIVLNKNWLF